MGLLSCTALHGFHLDFYTARSGYSRLKRYSMADWLVGVTLISLVPNSLQNLSYSWQFRNGHYAGISWQRFFEVCRQFSGIKSIKVQISNCIESSNDERRCAELTRSKMMEELDREVVLRGEALKFRACTQESCLWYHTV